MLSGKVAIITGASSGIGAATAVKFAECGVAKMCVTARSKQGLEETKQKCIAASKDGAKLAPDDILVVEGELTEPAFCRLVVDRTVEELGRLDILVNNAGIIHKLGPVETCDLQDYDNVMNINTRAVFCLTQLAVPHLKASKGNVVNVSSVNALRAFPNVAAYCMSKAALDMFTKCLALELASSGVRVNAVNPGVVLTNIHRRSGMDEEQYAAFVDRAKVSHALGRPGRVEEVSAMIAMLASDQASFITGNSTPIDGGRNLICPR